MSINLTEMELVLLVILFAYGMCDIYRTSRAKRQQYFLGKALHSQSEFNKQLAGKVKSIDIKVSNMDNFQGELSKEITRVQDEIIDDIEEMINKQKTGMDSSLCDDPGGPRHPGPAKRGTL